jgi:hypothetical protein
MYSPLACWWHCLANSLNTLCDHRATDGLIMSKNFDFIWVCLYAAESFGGSTIYITDATSTLPTTTSTPGWRGSLSLTGGCDLVVSRWSTALCLEWRAHSHRRFQFQGKYSSTRCFIHKLSYKRMRRFLHQETQNILHVEASTDMDAHNNTVWYMHFIVSTALIVVQWNKELEYFVCLIIRHRILPSAAR